MAKKMTEELAKKAVTMLKKGAKPGEIAEKLGVHHLSVVAVGRTAGVFKAAKKTGKPKAAKIRAANGKIVKAKPGRKASKTSSEFEQWFNTGLAAGFIKMHMEDDALKADILKQ